MTNLFTAPTYKTFGGKTAMKLIESAQVIETMSGDFLITEGDVELNVNDEYDMCVSGSYSAICNMDLNQDEWRMLTALEAKVEEKYQKNILGI